MAMPPFDPKYRTTFTQPTWGGIATLYALIAAVPVLLWAITNPLPAATAVVLLGGITVTARRAQRLRQCFQDCGGFDVELGNRVHFCVRNPRTA